MTDTVAVPEPSSFSQRFLSLISREVSAVTGLPELSEGERRLAQHLFLKVDEQLKVLDAQRKSGIPIVWANLNLQKLALDAVHRIQLGLDALIPNHIHPVPYANSSTGKYDVDLRVGYVGKDMIIRRLALNPPKDIIYNLVHETDTFTPIFRDSKNPVEGYEFVVNQPFSRGGVIGGFGYIVFEDDSLNRLVLVSEDEFKKSRNAAKTTKFWDAWPVEMRYKTLVHRVAAKIPLDPCMGRVLESYAAVERDERDELAPLEATAVAGESIVARAQEALEELKAAKEPEVDEGTEDLQGTFFGEQDGPQDEPEPLRPGQDPGLAFEDRCEAEGLDVDDAIDTIRMFLKLGPGESIPDEAYAQVLHEEEWSTFIGLLNLKGAADADPPQPRAPAKQ